MQLELANPALRVDGLWKEYVIGHAQPQPETFYELMGDALKAPLRRLRRPAAQVEVDTKFWALREISFSVPQGQVVGVIGRNGAGKSTLLKILSRITAPTRGRVSVLGRLASLLEVGTGFHPELSGRENIFLNGSILGMTRSEVAHKFDEIVDFAEIDKFVDTPVKRYSSGMYVRLAFSVAAHLETDVLLVDEVLAVGDASFQRKSLGKMGDVARGGRTVLFVSHNLNAVRNLCSRVLLLEGGSISFDGNVAEGLAMYERAITGSGSSVANARFDGPMSGQIRFDEIRFRQGEGNVTVIDALREVEIVLNGFALRFFPMVELKIGLFRDGFHIASCHDTPKATALAEGAFVSRFRIPADVLRPGRYSIGIGVSGTVGHWMWGAEVAVLDVSENMGGRSADRSAGAVGIPYSAERVQ